MESMQRNMSMNTNALPNDEPEDDFIAAPPLLDETSSTGTGGEGPASRRSLSTPLRIHKKLIQEQLDSWKPKENLPKLTDSKINAPLHAIVRSESL